jgi:hypothetical protein
LSCSRPRSCWPRAPVRRGMESRLLRPHRSNTLAYATPLATERSRPKGPERRKRDGDQWRFRVNSGSTEGPETAANPSSAKATKSADLQAKSRTAANSRKPRFGLITRRSRVRIPPPLLESPAKRGVFSFSEPRLRSVRGSNLRSKLEPRLPRSGQNPLYEWDRWRNRRVPNPKDASRLLSGVKGAG